MPLVKSQLTSLIFGAIAQLGERLPCTQEVSSSILLSSTTFKCIYASVFKSGIYYRECSLTIWKADI
jgi:hypothetical protein